MKALWNKFWNDEDFAIRAGRGLGSALGVYIMAGGLSGYIPNEVGLGVVAVAQTFSGGASK